MFDPERWEEYQTLLDSLSETRRKLGTLKRFARTNGLSQSQQREEESTIRTISRTSRRLQEDGVLDGFERLTSEARQLELRYAA